jgi:hypothetical protein
MGNYDKQIRVRLRPATHDKWLKIAKRKRWSLSETADALADAFLAQQEQQREPSPTDSAIDDPAGLPANAEPVGANG